MLKESVQKHGAGNWILGVCVCACVCVCVCVCVRVCLITFSDHIRYYVLFSCLGDTGPYWATVYASLAESSYAGD